MSAGRSVTRKMHHSLTHFHPFPLCFFQGSASIFCSLASTYSSHSVGSIIGSTSDPVLCHDQGLGARSSLRLACIPSAVIVPWCSCRLIDASIITTYGYLLMSLVYGKAPQSPPSWQKLAGQRTATPWYTLASLYASRDT